jgi:hypothetical protein
MTAIRIIERMGAGGNLLGDSNYIMGKMRLSDFNNIFKSEIKSTIETEILEETL